MPICPRIGPVDWKSVARHEPEPRSVRLACALSANDRVSASAIPEWPTSDAPSGYKLIQHAHWRGLYTRYIARFTGD